jgi:hypothetical protein
VNTEKEVLMSRSHLNTVSLVGAALAIAGAATVVFGSVSIGVVATSVGLITVAANFIHRRHGHHVPA